MFYSIFTPSNSTATAPSLCYSPMGYLSDDEVIALESQLEGSLCRIVAFDTKTQFERYLDDRDEEFWEQRVFVRHMISSGDLIGMEINTN